VEVSWPPGASVAGRPAMIELTVRDMALNLARVCSIAPGPAEAGAPGSGLKPAKKAVEDHARQALGARRRLAYRR
jgi:hypothetical protein